MKPRLRKFRWFPGVLLVTTGSVCLVLSGFLAIHQERFLLNAVRTKGVVVEMLPVKNFSNGSVACPCVPVFRFQAEDGQSYTIKADASTYTNPPKLKLGDAVPLLYDRGNPKGATQDLFELLWFGPITALVIGIGHGSYGVYLLCSGRRYRKRFAEPSMTL